MTEAEQNASTEIKQLESKIESLLLAYNSLKNENVLLKDKQETLVKEKARLLEKTALARTRVEAMISRLKSMENGS